MAPTTDDDANNKAVVGKLATLWRCVTTLGTEGFVEANEER